MARGLYDKLMTARRTLDSAAVAGSDAATTELGVHDTDACELVLELGVGNLTINHAINVRKK